MLSQAWKNKRVLGEDYDDPSFLEIDRELVEQFMRDTGMTEGDLLVAQRELERIQREDSRRRRVR